MTEPEQIARELLLLRLLKERVNDETEDRRAEVEKWSVGSKQVINLPNPESPNRPLKVGEVRLDKGATVAVVRDRGLWETWARENSPHNVIVQPAGYLVNDVPSTDEAAALTAAMKAAESQAGRFAPDYPAAMWRALRDAGWTLTPAVEQRERTVVLPAYETYTLQLSKEAGEPVTPEGLIPAGIEVTSAPGKAYITATKDPTLAAQFVAEMRDETAIESRLGLAIEGRQ